MGVFTLAKVIFLFGLVDEHSTYKRNAVFEEGKARPWNPSSSHTCDLCEADEQHATVNCKHPIVFAGDMSPFLRGKRMFTLLHRTHFFPYIFNEQASSRFD